MEFVLALTTTVTFRWIQKQETWLKDMENTDIYNIPDYILLSNPRTKKEVEELVCTFQIVYALRKEMI